MELTDTRQAMMRRFTLRFLLNTEFFSYFIIIPLLFIYFVVNLDITMENLILLLEILAFVIPISMTTTYISDRMEIGPVRAYFRKALTGAVMTEEEYELAQTRFFKLTYIHALGSLARWIFGLVMAYIPFTLLASLTPVQTFNVWTTVVVIPPFGMVLYFYLTERFVQRYLNAGIFSRLSVKKSYPGVNFMTRMIVSITVIMGLPLIAVAGYFLLQLERANVDWALSYGKLGLILLFGLLIASSIIYGLTWSIREKLALINTFMQRISDGDLSGARVVMAVQDDLTRVGRNVFYMRESLADIIREIRVITVQLEESADGVTVITESFSRDTQGQAATVEEVTATVEEISATMDSISRNAAGQMENLNRLIRKMSELTGTIREMDRTTTTALGLTGDIARQAASGGESLGRMKDNMGKIGERSRQMTSIIGIINDISDKINLLSLNASIEAARAGDAGRGFAVVADEISKLADTTASSVKEIGSLIQSSEQEIGYGITIVNDVVSGIGAIIDGVTKISGMTDSISQFMKRQIESNEDINREAGEVLGKSDAIDHSIGEQKTAMEEVVRSINSINELTQKISGGSEDIVASTRKSYDMANTLKKKIDEFRIS